MPCRAQRNESSSIRVSCYLTNEAFQCITVSGPPDSGLGPISHYNSYGRCNYHFIGDPLNTFSSKILVGILRHYIVLLLQSPPKKLPRAAIREQYVSLIFNTPCALATNWTVSLDVRSCDPKSSVLRRPSRLYLLISMSTFLDIFLRHSKPVLISKMDHHLKVTQLRPHRTPWTLLLWMAWWLGWRRRWWWWSPKWLLWDGLTFFFKASFSVSLYKNLQFLTYTLTHTSQIAFSINTWIQVHVTAWYRDTRYGRSMGILLIMVLP